MLPTFRSAVRRKLLSWYERNKRDLPWRRKLDPYAVWIAETMLQQTQVKTVIPYYEKFLQAFPTMESLARAPLPRVLRQWSGLGYYRRAENLSKAARQIVRRHRGKIPDDYDRLRALPGIGEYTAGAVLSIAFERRYPAIDGNAQRVLRRLVRIESERELRAMAAALVPRARPGSFNQALMELGATVCTPRNPRCRECPMDSLCASGSRARTRRARSERKAAQIKNVIWPLALIRRGGKILLRRRAGRGLLAGLWDLPGGQLANRERIATLLHDHLDELKSTRARPKKIGEIRHAITHRRIRAPIYLVDVEANIEVDLPRSRWRWIDPANVQKQATSSMTAKAVALFSSYEKNSR
ncbi:MAG: A/G-specific adenine glycosylase [Candidatus Binatia bacterium]